MFRFLALSLLGMGTIASMNAGQITVGQVVGGVNNGLTAAYIAGGCMSASCLPGSTGGTPSAPFFFEKNYAVTLFSGVTTTAPPPAQTTITSGGVSFALLNDGSTVDKTGTFANNYWDATGNFAGASGTLTIPVGLFGTDSAWTMINNRWGVTGTTNTAVTFVFGTASNTTDAGTLTFNLVNGVLERDAVDCSAKGTGTVNCTTFATTAPSATNVFSSPYTNGGTLNPYVGTTGSVSLNDQFYSFGGAFLNDYLSEVQITDENGGGSIGRTGISALTVDVASSSTTPEPSTILMIMTGLGALGLSRLRRKQ